ncbi:hypothetical protein FA13DRAFT_1715481 [Coprinellus micaceus]|uniref:Uncharacterized protein n=1 Tax=Coprinellus micaceus TaxID=71717 RepID=A0A4Y7SMY5_COPMI|nr:hypothetical protein FA13DRAFT_1715481 [Coprinellus micaceus]
MMRLSQVHGPTGLDLLGFRRETAQAGVRICSCRNHPRPKQYSNSMKTSGITSGETSGNVADEAGSSIRRCAEGLPEFQTALGSALPHSPESPPSEPRPPTYQQAQLDASACPLDDPDGMWITVQCKKDPLSEFSKLSPGSPPQPPFELEEAPPKLPEFYQALSRFEEAHSDLQGHAEAICKITRALFDIQHDLSKIHEYWMEVGLHDFAHDVIPIIDCGSWVMRAWAITSTNMSLKCMHDCMNWRAPVDVCEDYLIKGRHHSQQLNFLSNHHDLTAASTQVKQARASHTISLESWDTGRKDVGLPRAQQREFRQEKYQAHLLVWLALVTLS